MSAEFYSLLALGARYIFAGLMALIVLCAVRDMLVDSRRAATLRRLQPQTGQRGTLMITQGQSRKARKGMTYVIIREGMIGRSRYADVRIRDRSIGRRHAYFQLTDEGMVLRAHGSAPMCDPRGRSCAEMVLTDGARFMLGDVSLLLVLSVAEIPHISDDDERPDPFQVDSWEDDDPAWYEPRGRKGDAPETLFDDEPDLNGDGFNEKHARRSIERHMRERHGEAPPARDDSPDVPDDLFFDDDLF